MHKCGDHLINLAEVIAIFQDGPNSIVVLRSGQTIQIQNSQIAKEVYDCPEASGFLIRDDSSTTAST